jgi:CRISPR-associated protein Csm4
MRVTIYKLRFPHGVHVGTYGIGTEGVRVTVPSDTLFSALLSAWIALGNNPDLWISQFPRTAGNDHAPADPPFLLTSAFPYKGDVLLFPKPLDPNYAQGIPEKARKKWKKLQFISEIALLKLAKGNSIGELIEEGNFRRNGQVLVYGDEIPEGAVIWNEHAIPRVTLDRVSSASNLFHVGRVDFAGDAGLWFGVIWRDPERPCGDVVFKEAFELALNALAHYGLGGDRSVGYGVFEPELMDELKWPAPAADRPAVLLSRYNPRPDELPNVLRNSPGYRLEEVRGWTSSPHGQYRRRSIVMLKEGSVIRAQGGIMGHVVDVGPLHAESGEPLLPHPVWRYGLAALWPLGGGG